MAVTEFGVNASQTVKLWSKMTMREALKGTLLFKKFVGSSKRSIIQQVTDLEKSAGDTVYFDLLMQMTGGGVTGDNLLKGNEEALVYHQDTLVIDQLRHGHEFRSMTQQRTIHDLRKDAQENLSDWWADAFESYMFRYLCGDTTLSHGQAGLAPDADHSVWSGDATSDATIGDNDQFSLEDLDYAKERAKTLTPPIRPVRINGGEYYAVVLHPYSVTDMRIDVLANPKVSWQDIQQYANVRGLKNPIFSGALGVYNGMVLHESNYIYSPLSNVRRNLLLGAQAGVFAIGNAYDAMDRKKMGGNNMLSWAEEVDDYGNRKGIGVGCKFGMKKTRFNSKDYGAITIASYGAQHS